MPEEKAGENLLRLSAEWRLLSLLTERPRRGWNKQARALADEIGDPLLKEAVALCFNASEETYLAVFGPGGFVSPREVAYAGYEDPGQLLADLAGFYRTFGFVPQSEEPTDHISVQAGFAGYLALKEVYAEKTGRSEAAQITRHARQVFLEFHLSRLVRGIAEKLSGGGPVYLIKAVEAMLIRLAHIPVRRA